MNLYKISKKLEYLIDTAKSEEIPDVLSLYNVLGYDVMGRKIYKNLSDKHCFNKSIKHKEFPCYIGKARNGFYQQSIIDCEIKEIRCFCINGVADKYHTIAGLVSFHFNIKNFVFDVYIKENDKANPYLMEVNELHLSTISKSDLDFIFKQIL